MKAFICILIISISLYTILKMYIEYGNIFSITVSATVGVTLLCLSTTSTDNRSIEMKKTNKSAINTF